MTPAEIVQALRSGGRPQIPKPTVPEVFPIIEAYYAIPCFGLGGIAHLWMEDPNYEQHTAEWTLLEQALAPPDAEYPMQHDFDVFVAWLSTQMSPTQRSKCSKLATYDIYADGRHTGPAPFWSLAEAFMSGRPVSEEAAR